ncbi:zinc ribbon domain-containing protein [Marinobacter sp. CHS3-4]|uniref:zinc ribbon domain-containing protein n=1 Tax=Marinobacter sp. CHS3-4 TaxID=3045174 RepID=UPI0024B61CB9|nr:zinc ribbon domain-containing protein [Marinobacter sp. CHS3-4]MDI9243841.1 zinc ribbon domain-containing protein [Marinobacter sp. CHS3-4]
MPVYDYKCREHGLFNTLATMEDSAKPVACPTCKALSPRVIVLPPEIAAMDPAKRAAEDRNEKSRHEPVFSTADQRANDKDHNRACGCGSVKHGHGKSMLFYTADGKKMFPSMRPWMISH